MASTDDTQVTMGGPGTTGRRGGLGVIGACLEATQGLLDDAVDEQAWRLGDEDLRLALSQALRVRASVEELTVRLAASVVDRELPRLAGASSPRSWLMSVHGMSATDATRLLAGTLAQDPKHEGRCQPTRTAWSAGDISTEQAVLIAKTVTSLADDIPATATDALQVDLVREAPALSYVGLQQLCRHAVEVVDPAGADATLEAQLLAEEARALQLTTCRVWRVGDGTTRYSGRMSDLHGDMLKAMLAAGASPRRTSSRPDSSFDPADRDGDHCDTEIGQLSLSQRWGRAFVELLEHLPADNLPQHGGLNASVVVTMTLDQLNAGLGAAILDSGSVISTGQARRLACNASLVPAVLGGASKVLDLGMGQRLFDRYQRIALAVRDRGCVWPGCDRPPSFCEAHHVTEWSRGGPTDLANGCLLCSWHHHLVHQGEWAVRMAADGVPEVTPPSRVDPTRLPLRHERFKHRALC